MYTTSKKITLHDSIVIPISSAASLSKIQREHIIIFFCFVILFFSDSWSTGTSNTLIIFKIFTSILETSTPLANCNFTQSRLIKTNILHFQNCAELLERCRLSRPVSTNKNLSGCWTMINWNSLAIRTFRPELRRTQSLLKMSPSTMDETFGMQKTNSLKDIFIRAELCFILITKLVRVLWSFFQEDKKRQNNYNNKNWKQVQNWYFHQPKHTLKTRASITN